METMFCNSVSAAISSPEGIKDVRVKQDLGASNLARKIERTQVNKQAVKNRRNFTRSIPKGATFDFMSAVLAAYRLLENARKYLFGSASKGVSSSSIVQVQSKAL